MTHFTPGIRAHATAFIRKPQNLILLVVVPPVVTVLYGNALKSISLVLSATGANPGTVGRLTGALFATAFLTGIIGLFQVISARRGDERLVLCGFSRSTLLATRLLIVICAAVLATTISFAVLWATVSVDALLATFGALLVGGVTYGLIGMLIGALLPKELEGSLVLVFLVDIDDALSSGLFESTTDLMKLLPLYRPHSLVESAVTEGSVATDDVLGAAVYFLVLLVVAFVIYRRMIATGGEAG